MCYDNLTGQGAAVYLILKIGGAIAFNRAAAVATKAHDWTSYCGNVI